MENDEMARAQKVEDQLRETWGGDTVDCMFTCVRYQNVPADAIKRAVHSPAAVEDFTRLGSEAMLQTMQGLLPSDADYRNLDRAYNKIRSRQRDDWMFQHGRGGPARAER